jgi:hypothetical protein
MLVFWELMACSLTEVYCFRTKQVASGALLFHPEDGCYTFLQNFIEPLPGYTALHFRRYCSSWSLSLDPQIQYLK